MAVVWGDDAEDVAGASDYQWLARCGHSVCADDVAPHGRGGIPLSASLLARLMHVEERHRPVWVNWVLHIIVSHTIQTFILPEHYENRLCVMMIE